MATTFESIGLGRLSPVEKLGVVGELWDDLVGTVPPGALLSPAQREELTRRIQDAEVNPNDWVSLEDALSKTIGKLNP